jgi:hypothetical protein
LPAGSSRATPPRAIGSSWTGAPTVSRSALPRSIDAARAGVSRAVGWPFRTVGWPFFPGSGCEIIDALMPTTSPEAPVALEVFAQLSAEIDAGAGAEEVIARANLTETDWAKAKKHWLARMAEEGQRKRFELTNRYTTVFKASRAIAAVKLAQKKASPDAAKESEAEPTVRSDPRKLDGAPAVVAPPVVAPPVVAPPVVTPVVAPPPPVISRRAPPSEKPPSTAPIPPRQPPRPTPMGRLDDDAQEEGTLVAPTAEVQKEVLPFRTSAPPRAGKKINLGSTVSLEDLGVLDAARRGGALPFQKSTDDGTGTAPPTKSPFAPGGAGDLPFLPPSKTRFTLQQFASLSAEIAESPDRVEQSRQRYGVSQAEHMEEARLWRQQFDRDAELAGRFAKLVQDYRSYLKRTRSTP